MCLEVNKDIAVSLNSNFRPMAYFKPLAMLFALLTLTSPAQSKPYTDDQLLQAGNFLQFAIPVGAGMISVAKGDGEGLGQLVEGALITSMATHVLKVTLDQPRPNGGHYSMPSGHTSAAMQGAAYLQFRYGWEYGVPAYMLGGIVGYSRVENNRHYWRDVVAGTLLATTIQFGITQMGMSVTNIVIAPMFNGDEVGIYASMSF